MDNFSKHTSGPCPESHEFSSLIPYLLRIHLNSILPSRSTFYSVSLLPEIAVKIVYAFIVSLILAKWSETLNALDFITLII